MKTHIKIILFALLVLGTGITACKPNKGAEKTEKRIMVFAAASLTDVLSELIDSFGVSTTYKVQTNMASSGTLARQIEQGGTPDIYISASKRWADYVDSLGFIVAPYKTNIAFNELVFIAPKESILTDVTINNTLDLNKLIGSGRLSMGDPGHVPAGKYGKQVLEYYGWNSQINGKVLPAKDVRSALMVVELGEAPLGIVYKTDALKSEKVKIIGSFPEESHKPIVYVAGICNESDASKAFYSYLTSEKTAAIWEKYGFKK
ncbi:molybdate ABC transporter substrate-binding protein [Saccharicrinis sp. FJH62]|uniref:molybdate ABC transporter substrate-binding protein n=1 Tax=Saccharicrinis sp. FJH62 TaxID=3344657 RepID=UPI0035D3F600